MSKTFVYTCIAVLFVLCGLSIYFLKDSYKILPFPTTEVTMPARSEWKEFTAPSGRFKVMLPLVPQQASERLTDPETKESRVYDMYVAQELDGTMYMVSLIVFSDKKGGTGADDLLKTTISDMVKANPNNKLSKMDKTTYDAYPAYDFKIENVDMTIDGKAVMDQDTLYILSTIEHNKQYNPGDFDYFIKSFKLLK